MIMTDGPDYYVDDSAVVINVTVKPTAKIYKGTRVTNCTLDEYVSVGEFSLIQQSELEANITIQRNNTIFI